MAKPNIQLSSYDKRLMYLIAGSIAVVALVLTAILALPALNREEEPQINSSVPVSESERIAAESVSREFIKTVGNFGIRTNALTGDNIRTVTYLINNSEGASLTDYIITRQDAYNEAKTNHILSGSSLDYDSRAVSQWKSPFEMSRLATFATGDISPSVSENGRYINIAGEDTKAIDVQVTFDSMQTIRDVTANDTTWDGSYAVLEKPYVNNTVDLILVETEDGWKIYNQDNLKYQFLLSTWKTPNSDAYSNVQSNFTRVDTLNLTEPLKEP